MGYILFLIRLVTKVVFEMPSILLRGALRPSKFTGLRQCVRFGSHSVENVKPVQILKFDPHDDPYFHESLRHPIPVGPRMIVIPEELKPLKEKERGDWKNLTQEKDSWKSNFGIAFMYISLALCTFTFMRVFIYQPRNPYLSSEQCVIDQIHWQLKSHQNPITGYPSMWDYENNCWKKWTFLYQNVSYSG